MDGKVSPEGEGKGRGMGERCGAAHGWGTEWASGSGPKGMSGSDAAWPGRGWDWSRGRGGGGDRGRGGKVWVKGEVGWRERGRMEREKPSGFGENRMDWERGGLSGKR